MDESSKNKANKKNGRRPKNDPAIFRYSVSLNAAEHAKFLSLFEQSGMKIKAHFITGCIFQKTVKTIKIDKGTLDFYRRLTNLYSQFRSVGINYNQVVKILYRNFSEKKAAAYLFKLEKHTIEMTRLCKQIIQLTETFEAKQQAKNETP